MIDRIIQRQCNYCGLYGNDKIIIDRPEYRIEACSLDCYAGCLEKKLVYTQELLWESRGREEMYKNLYENKGKRRKKVEIE